MLHTTHTYCVKAKGKKYADEINGEGERIQKQLGNNSEKIIAL